MTNQNSSMTVPKFREAKSAGRKLAVVTAFDSFSGRVAEAAGVDAVLVGDSLAMVVQGHETTLQVTLDEMIYHARMTRRAVTNPLLIVDMPFPTYHVSTKQAITNAARVVQETGCQAVKIEGGVRRADRIKALVQEGIPVMGHVGLTPQDVHAMGGYTVQRDRTKLLEDARAVEESGAFSVVLECIPTGLAAEITESLSIPTIGIGAGPQCDGQVLVFHDMLGMGEDRPPKHARRYADLSQTATEAVHRYAEDVRSGKFPDERESFTD
jgi:3-methyl-2-oxobutanoate hydroxymethyltransferase